VTGAGVHVAAVTSERWQYVVVIAGCLLVTLPLELVLGARVYRQPGRLVRSLAPAVAVFVAWDVVAIDRGHWSYNSRYVTGWRLLGALPVEELAFFVAVPICALLTYEAVKIVLGATRRPIPGQAPRPAARGTRAAPDA
jgi:lycopene cyclase domain-containing protein